MAKDPAFLFYSADFIIGTSFMTDEQIGKYVRLLCFQHQTGHLSEFFMLQVCKTKDEIIFSKFKVDDQGLYYNERLDLEVKRRTSYSESRRNNRSKRDMSNICKTHVRHMETETETETETENITKDVSVKDRGVGKGFSPPSLQEVIEYCQERKSIIDPQYFFDSNTAKGWVDKNGNRYKDWKAVVRTWEKWEQSRIYNLTPTQKANIRDFQKWERGVFENENTNI